MSEKHYLENLANRVGLFVDAKEEAVKWLVDHQIRDKDKIQNALIMSQIWLANQLDISLTMADLMIYLGDNSEVSNFDRQVIELDEEMRHLSLDQVLKESVNYDD